jgi:NAD kinase
MQELLDAAMGRKPAAPKILEGDYRAAMKAALTSLSAFRVDRAGFTAASTIRVLVGKQRSIVPHVSCDGATGFPAYPGDELIVRKKQGALRLIHPLDHNYYETCRSKLGWGNRLVRADD